MKEPGHFFIGNDTCLFSYLSCQQETRLNWIWNGYEIVTKQLTEHAQCEPNTNTAETFSILSQQGEIKEKNISAARDRHDQNIMEEPMTSRRAPGDFKCLHMGSAFYWIGKGKPRNNFLPLSGVFESAMLYT